MLQEKKMMLQTRRLHSPLSSSASRWGRCRLQAWHKKGKCGSHGSSWVIVIYKCKGRFILCHLEPLLIYSKLYLAGGCLVRCYPPAAQYPVYRVWALRKMWRDLALDEKRGIRKWVTISAWAACCGIGTHTQTVTTEQSTGCYFIQTLSHCNFSTCQALWKLSYWKLIECWFLKLHVYSTSENFPMSSNIQDQLQLFHFIKMWWCLKNF